MVTREKRHHPSPSEPAAAGSGRGPALVLAALIAGGALVFDPGGWQTFGPSKWTWITTAAWLALAAALHRGVSAHRGSVLAWGVFLTWAGFTSAVALDPRSAWIGTPDRRMGMVGLATLAAAYIAGQTVDTPGRRHIARAAAVALAGMTVYGAAEALGRPPVDLTTTTSRLGSTFGSPAYLGAALCLLAPISAGLAADGRERRAWRGVAAVATAGAGFLLVGSATRAAVVGLAAASAFLLISGYRPRRSVVGAVAVAMVAAVLLMPGAWRLTEPGVEGRLAEWETATRALADRPVTGVGLEGYRVSFPAHVDVEYVNEYGRSTVTDRAHSGPLDLALAVGAPGMVAWITAAVWLTARARAATRSGDPLVTGMAAGVVALLAQELFLFPTVEVGVAAWAVSGVVVAASSRVSARPRSRPAAVAAAIVAIALAGAGMADVTADRLAGTARASGDPAVADRAASLRPDSFRYPLLAADLALRSGEPAGAMRRIEAAAALAPGDPALRLARARVATELVTTGQWEAARGSALLEQMVRADPNHPELRLLHGEALALLGEASAAEQAWLAAGHLAADDPTPRLRLAALYLALDERDLARAALEEARRLQPGHPDLARLERDLENP